MGRTGSDSCWFVGSAISYLGKVTGGSWTVSSANVWGDDFVGWFPDSVTYYRRERPLRGYSMPCLATIPQDMVIGCNQSNPAYTRNTLRVTIGTQDVGSERDGQVRFRIWP